VEEGKRFSKTQISSIYLEPEKWDWTRGWDENCDDISIIPREASFHYNTLLVTSSFMSMHKINSVSWAIDINKKLYKLSLNASLGW